MDLLKLKRVMKLIGISDPELLFECKSAYLAKFAFHYKRLLREV